MRAAPRVCFFNRSYHPDQAATGQLLTELAEDLTGRHGWEVWVVAGPPLVPRAGAGRPARGWIAAREEHNGVYILRARGTTFRPRRFAGRIANYLTYFACACWAGLRAPRPDVVVALTDPPIIGLAALLTARWAGAPFVFLSQDVFPEAARALPDFRSGAVNRLLDRVSRRLVARADRVVALGETMRERLVAGKGADPDRVAVIHNWADCAAIVPGPKRNAFSLAHGLAERFVVMHSGNLGLSQDLDTLLEAADRLRAHPEVLVALVGDGARREALESRARARGLANVRFLPYQPREGLRDSFASADVFVVSLKRGLAGYIVPSKLYGVLAAGRPYVAAVEEPSEVAAITRASGAGFLAEPGDADDLAGKILALCRDRGLAGEMGLRARRAALGFDRAVQIERYDRLLRDLLGRRPVAGYAPPAKRALDVALSALGLLVSMPLWGLIAALVKLGDGGPVFYGQERVGREGRPFVGWKFRTMVPDADRRFGPMPAAERDPRVTRVGRLLRATAMDELPQLWSIFKGDMSFVGPRPLRPEEGEATGGGVVRLSEVPGYRERHRVRPGLTGLAQVYAARDVPVRHKFRLDRLYVERQSLWLDLKLIALSFWITFRGRWEHRGRKV